MVAINHDGLAIPGRVDLAHELPFALAGLFVDPGTRQVSGVGISQTLEPRVMQVLVALARARGAIVTREELIQSCWSGRTVGDDSINRVLARIRAVAAGIGQKAFRVETITKVGYRLLEGQAAPSGDAAEARRSPTEEARPAVDHSRRVMIGGTAFAAVALGVVGWRQLATPDFEPKPEALALYRMGISARAQGLVATSDQAMSYFRQAVRADPNYADAWGALARQLAGRGQTERTIEGAHSEVRSAAKRALALDPRQVDALGTLAIIGPQYGRWREYEQTVLQYLGEHPGYLPAQIALAALYANVGSWDKAIHVLRVARAASPLLPNLSNLLSIALWGAGRSEESESESAKGMELWPRFHGMWFNRMLLLTYSGNPERALAFAANREIWPMGALAEDIIHTRIATARALVSRDSNQLAFVQSAVLKVVDEDILNVPAAVRFFSAIGDTKTMFELLDAYYRRIGRFAGNAVKPIGPLAPLTTEFLLYPTSKILWKDRRFDALTRDIGLHHYWRAARVAPPHRSS